MEGKSGNRAEWYGKRNSHIRSHATAAGPRGLLVDAGVNANICSTISTNVVLVRAELATLGGDTLELLLGRRVGVANLHQHALVSNGGTMVLLDNLLALLARLEPRGN